MKKTKTYTIFFDPKNVYNYVKIKCYPGKLIETLIEEELLKTPEEYNLVNWVIFEGSVLIK